MGRIKNDNKKKEEFILKSLAGEKISEYRDSSQVINHPVISYDLISSHIVNLFVRAYVHNYSGYGELAREFLKRIKHENEVSVKLAPIRCLQEVDPIEMTEIDSMRKPRDFDIKNSIFLGISNPLHFGMNEKFVNCGRYKIAWTMLESLDLSKNLVNCMDSVDEIWSPSRADMRRFRDCDANMIHMPYGYDELRYNNDVKPADIANVRGKYVFGFVGSWYDRKSIKEIIKSFCLMFSKKDNVSLLLISKYFGKPYNETKSFADCGYCRNEEEIQKWTIEWEFDRIIEYIEKCTGKNRKDFPHISIIDSTIHSNIMPNIIKRFDCLVGFSKGESLWLPGMQALAMGVPVIQLESLCSGFMDYLDDYPYLCKRVEYREADESLCGFVPMYKEQKFAYGCTSELAIMMEAIMKEKRLKDMMSDISRKIERYTWKSTIKSVLERLFLIQSNL